MACCDIFAVFNENDNLIKEYKHWRLLIRNRNTTLGNCVAITKRHIENFGEITPEEMRDFSEVVKDIEKSLKKSFSYDKINYLMLMMRDKHTHFHIIPRYSIPRNFAGIEFTDEGWPKQPTEPKSPLPTTVLQQIKEEIIENI